MAEVLVDTDVFVDHLRGARRLRAGGDSISYSTVTRCELFAGVFAGEAKVRVLLSAYAELPVDRAVAERAGRLRRGTRTRIADALIAATALEHNLGLVTRNVRHFEQVEGLQVRLPR
ncbi:MAG: type II toxin-antitoxin system VapC family toxin [Chloroflexota bacterium]